MSQTAVPTQSPRQSLTRTVVAGAVGNVLEWYDFGLFGFFAPVISQQFMPHEDRLAALVGTFVVFALGFVVRPLGGLLFGRKLALELSVLLMAGSTTLLGLLPTYAAVGMVAPLLLALTRLLQGLSVGGEYIGSMSFLTEHAPPGRRGFVGSWSSFTVVLGTLIGSAAAAACTMLLSAEQLAAPGWRVPFLCGLLIGAAGFWLRLGVEESPTFLRLQETGQLAANPIAETVRVDTGAIALTLALTGFMAVGYYLPFVWLPTWLSQINRPALPEGQALSATTVALVVLLILTPLTGFVSDRVGRRPMFLAGALGYALLSYPVFVRMTAGGFADALVAGLVFAVCCSLFAGCMAATLVELFPTRTRYTGMAIGYNLGQGLLGGTAPLIGTWLIHVTGNRLAPAFYLTAWAAVGVLACLFLKARHGGSLEEACG